MRAVIYDRFGELPELRDVPDPAPPDGGVVVAVRATGLCRSDWHGWRGHDTDIRLPHVPGHEFAGEIAAVGAGVRDWRVGDRVTAPFVCACGSCPACLAGDQQVCHRQEQPGFTYWGSFADLVVVPHAQTNLVRLDDRVGYAAAATLGCRFATAFRAVVAQGRARPGEWVAVHGCGGVGLSAVMIAVAAGARVVAVDVSAEALALARRFGAEATVDAATPPAPAIRELTGGGAHLSLDALGSQATLTASVEGLRRRGRHVQVGLLPAATGRPTVPMELVVAHELEILGSHGMAAHAYRQLLPLVGTGALRPAELITGELALAGAPAALAAMDRPGPAGIQVIVP
ncbi:zinc-dependent alcohol dehydrogenase family protein [Amorphoplanes nipponensis]|uniref:Alcohol dehydrogenase n=1 Tax=Actinoplanes nipponensis TaxID=135950 RepID=A0A919MKL8_9ACTN|nr:alcohol dehydrogenase catalytic domain-containing protein [Actinoplanes nipponensis]GIE47857.1 alcohol dehydrogenase [Actinoplanes nipponensis]